MRPSKVHRRSVWSFAGIVLAIVAVLTAAGASSASSAETGTLAVGANGQIWVLSPTKLHAHELRTGPGASHPAFAPSGNTIAFQRRTHGGPIVYVTRVSGGVPRPLGPGATPVFSPDGRWIVVSRPEGLAILALRSGRVRRSLTSGGFGDVNPSWGLNGLIAFERDRGVPGIYVIRSNGTGLRLIASATGGHLVNPAWSPDGRTLLVSQGCDLSDAGFQSASYSGSVTFLPVSSSDCAVAPAWAPDGSAIIFGEPLILGVYDLMSNHSRDLCVIGGRITSVAWGTRNLPPLPLAPFAVHCPRGAAGASYTVCVRSHGRRHCAVFQL